MSNLRKPGHHAVFLALALLMLAGAGAYAQGNQDPLDPARGVPLPCEAVSLPGLIPRSAMNLQHVANVCGIVGTDIEFQSRLDADGRVRDYAFLGTMGFGLRIFDISDPQHPVQVGGYADPGWQNDVQVRGDLAVISVDPIHE